MTALFLEPHNDDVALFAAYSALGEKDAHIVTCLRSFAQGDYQPPIYYWERELESKIAASQLGCTWEQWTIPDNLSLEMMMKQLGDTVEAELARLKPDRVYAPLQERGGHVHHNLLGKIAYDLVPSQRLTRYCTYVRGETRTRTNDEVVAASGWAARKYAALACYQTQINSPLCQPWFVAEDALREWIG